MEKETEKLRNKELENVQTILKSATFKPYVTAKLRHNFGAFCKDLGITHPCSTVKLEGASTLQSTLVEAVTDWGIQNGTEATLEKLCAILSSNNLQSITDMILQTCQQPTKPSVLPLLNQEEWEIIFHHIERPIDMLQFIRACPTFNEWFKSKTMDHLFAEVLPIFVDWVNQSMGQWQEPLGMELKNTILSSRLVSKRICAAVEKELNSHWQNYSLASPFLFPGPVTKNVFATTDEIRNFLQDMRHHPQSRSPIISRVASISFAIQAERLPETTLEEQSVCRLLLVKKTGIFLHSLYLSFTGIHVGRETRDILLSLLAILTQTPNLKNFGLLIHSAPGELLLNPASDLEGGILSLPHLPFLTDIEFEGTYLFGEIKWVMKHFQHLFHQLEDLKVDNVQLWNDNFNFRSDLFSNLQRLSIMCCFFDDRYALDTLNKLVAPKLALFILRFDERISKRRQGRLKRKGLNILNRRFHNYSPWQFTSIKDPDEEARHQLTFFQPVTEK